MNEEKKCNWCGKKLNITADGEQICYDCDWGTYKPLASLDTGLIEYYVDISRVRRRSKKRFINILKKRSYRLPEISARYMQMRVECFNEFIELMKVANVRLEHCRAKGLCEPAAPPPNNWQTLDVLSESNDYRVELKRQPDGRTFVNICEHNVSVMGVDEQHFAGFIEILVHAQMFVADPKRFYDIRPWDHRFPRR